MPSTIEERAITQSMHPFPNDPKTASKPERIDERATDILCPDRRPAGLHPVAKAAASPHRAEPSLLGGLDLEQAPLAGHAF